MPLKRAILPLLDEISETAASVEAVNTVVFTDDGRKVGDNTDIPGMIAALRERGVETVESAAVLGAGATASSALAALARICTGPVTAYVRSEDRAAEMRELGRAARRRRTHRRLGRSAAQALRAPLVIATTPAGTTDALAAAVPERPATLFDVLYEPWPTETRGGLVGPWRSRRRRAGPPGPPSRAPGRADDRAPRAPCSAMRNAGERGARKSLRTPAFGSFRGVGES